MESETTSRVGDEGLSSRHSRSCCSSVRLSRVTFSASAPLFPCLPHLGSAIRGSASYPLTALTAVDSREMHSRNQQFL